MMPWSFIHGKAGIRRHSDSVVSIYPARIGSNAKCPYALPRSICQFRHLHREGTTLLPQNLCLRSSWRQWQGPVASADYSGPDLCHALLTGYRCGAFRLCATSLLALSRCKVTASSGEVDPIKAESRRLHVTFLSPQRAKCPPSQLTNGDDLGNGSVAPISPSPNFCEFQIHDPITRCHEGR